MCKEKIRGNSGEEKISKPLEEGDLGLRSTIMINEPSNLKHAWIFTIRMKLGLLFSGKEF